MAAIPTLGFMAAGALMALALVPPSQHERASLLGHLGLAMVVLAVALGFSFAFSDLLNVPLPVGALWR